MQICSPGYLENMDERVAESEIGDIQIHADGYLAAPSLFTVIEDSTEIVAKLEEAGIAASPRLLGGPRRRPHGRPLRGGGFCVRALRFG